jgi:hypothetical protein
MVFNQWWEFEIKKLHVIIKFILTLQVLKFKPDLRFIKKQGKYKICISPEKFF